MTKTVLTYQGGVEHELIAYQARVRATCLDGTVVEGTVVHREWWFEAIMIYTVREDANGRPFADVPDYQIWPGRDPIEVI